MIDELPVAPDPAIDAGEQFSQKAAAYVLAQKNMVPQINTALANLSALAAGGAYSLQYTVDLSSTADSDPGSGKLRFDNATQNAATTLRLDTVVAGVDVSSLLDQFDASTSTVKGAIRLQKVGDQSKWLTFNVTARAAPVGYRNITVTNTGASTANPFVNGDDVMLFFQRAGDKGSTGASYYEKLAEAVISAPVANVDFLNIFSAAYDKYVVEAYGLRVSAADAISLRVATGGATVSSAGLYRTGTTDGATISTLTNSFPLHSGDAVTSIGHSLDVEISNVNDAVNPKLFSSKGLVTNTAATVGVNRTGSWTTASAVTGFRLFLAAGANFTAGTVRVYGIKNS